MQKNFSGLSGLGVLKINLVCELNSSPACRNREDHPKCKHTPVYVYVLKSPKTAPKMNQTYIA